MAPAPEGGAALDAEGLGLAAGAAVGAPAGVAEALGARDADAASGSGVDGALADGDAAGVEVVVDFSQPADRMVTSVAATIAVGRARRVDVLKGKRE